MQIRQKQNKLKSQTKNIEIHMLNTSMEAGRFSVSRLIWPKAYGALYKKLKCE